MKEILNDVPLSPPFRSDRLLPSLPMCSKMEHVLSSKRSSRWDRYLGMTAPMTQVPVPTANEI